MRLCIRTLVGAGMLALAGDALAGTAVVSFVNASSFADAGASALERDRNLKTLSDHVQQLATRLPANQVLKVEVLDVDLAGEMHWIPRANRLVRVVRGTADWPSIALRYSLETDGAVVKSGTESLTDMRYTTMGTPPASQEPLGYEKRMLDRWFSERFLAPIQGG